MRRKWFGLRAAEHASRPVHALFGCVGGRRNGFRLNMIANSPPPANFEISAATKNVGAGVVTMPTCEADSGDAFWKVATEQLFAIWQLPA